jgi:hypothetical protein
MKKKDRIKQRQQGKIIDESQIGKEWENMSRKDFWGMVVFIAFVIFIMFWVNGHAQPYLVCDPQAGVATYQFTGQPSPLPATTPAQADGSLKLDMATTPTGTYTIQVKACNAVWGCSSSTPFMFTRPASVVAPLNLKLTQ